MPDALKKLNLLIRSQNLKEGEKGLRVRNCIYVGGVEEKIFHRGVWHRCIEENSQNVCVYLCVYVYI